MAESTATAKALYAARNALLNGIVRYRGHGTSYEDLNAVEAAARADERARYTALVEAAREVLWAHDGVDGRRMVSAALRALDPDDPAIVQPAERCPDCDKPLPHAFNFACEGKART